MTTPFPIRRRPPELIGRRRECDALDRLIEAARSGESRALVVRGEPGVGKTALLEYLAERGSGCRLLRAAGVQSEMELAFAGLHQLCAPPLDRLDRLPTPQRDALRTAFGESSGTPPERFLVGLAVLNLLADVAEQQPLICLIDDEQWLDHASAQVLAFVARRLHAEAVALVFAARVPSQELAGLPQLEVEGLRESDARALLDAVLPGPLDAQVRDQIVSETRGNPLALLELPRGLTPSELAGGFGFPDSVPLSTSIEESFRQRIDDLPPRSRRLLRVAAADPTGDPALVWLAAERLGITTEAATPAADAGLLEFGTRVRFRHPLVRSAAYQMGSLQERQDVHRALAEVTDAELDADRRAWHLAHAAPGPDEAAAGALERSAGRAQARGGLSAAAAFLEQAAILTPEPARRAQRFLAAARAKRDAGALDAALALLAVVEAAPGDALWIAEVERLRGQIAFDQRRCQEAVPLLLDAARKLAQLNPDLARETFLEALVAAIWAGDLNNPGGALAAAEAARPASLGPESPRVVDLLLDGLARRLTEGYAAAAPAMAQALESFFALDLSADEAGRWLTDERAGQVIALELWDFKSWQALSARQVQFARDMGALVHLRLALSLFTWTHVVAGELTRAAELIDEDRLLAEAMGQPPRAYNEMLIVAMVETWRGHTSRASELLEATVRDATARGLGRYVTLAEYTSAVLSNSLGRHDAARDVAWQAFERDPVGYGPVLVPELAEAATRTGDTALVRAALDWLSERTRVTPSEWALGMEARVRAFLSEGDAADALYRESIERLGRTPLRMELARGHLLYEEWLRRDRRRVSAREQLRTAHGMFASMGAEAFAERASRELLATGETVRKRTVETSVQLTAQERQIARFARDGLTNPEIGTRLFISPRTVQYHLTKVFTKLGVNSRGQLDFVLPGDPTAASPF